MSRDCREMLFNVGTLEKLLDTIFTADGLGELIKDAGESPPRLKAERVTRLSELLRSGQVDFMTRLVKGVPKDDLVMMCDAVNLDTNGKMADLANRLLAWWTAQGMGASKFIDKNNTGSSKPTLSAPQPVTLTNPIAAVPSASSSQVANPTPLLSVPISERQFIQVSSKREDSLVSGLMGIASGISRFLEGNATRVLRVHPSTIEPSMFFHGHPVNEGFYVADPFHPTRYIQATDAPRKILEEKIAALTLIAACLGATRIEFVAITQQGRKITTSSDVEAMGKQVGLDTVLGFQRSSHDRLSTSWPTSEVKPIPESYLPYLHAMPDLRALADMVYANRMPSSMQREVQLDMRDSQEIAVKVSRIPGIGRGSGQIHRTIEESTSWTFAIYFGTAAHPGASSGYEHAHAPSHGTPPALPSLAQAPPGYAQSANQAAAASGKFCTGCGARLELSSRFCGTCGVSSS